MKQQNTSALNTMIGGDHYKQGSIQPIEYIYANKLGYIEGCVIKYITRYKLKNGKEDLEKIKHYIDLLIELEYSEKDEPLTIEFHEENHRTGIHGEGEYGECFEDKQEKEPVDLTDKKAFDKLHKAFYNTTVYGQDYNN